MAGRSICISFYGKGLASKSVLNVGGRVLFVLKLAVSLRQCKIHVPKPLMRQDGRRSVQRGIYTCLGS
jgi:hypothetical protein